MSFCIGFSPSHLRIVLSPQSWVHFRHQTHQNHALALVLATFPTSGSPGAYRDPTGTAPGGAGGGGGGTCAAREKEKAGLHVNGTRRKLARQRPTTSLKRVGQDASKWYKMHGYASNTVYAQARIWYRLRATLHLVPSTCNPSVSAPPRPLRLPVSLLGCFAGVIVYLYIRISVDLYIGVFLPSGGPF